MPAEVRQRDKIGYLTLHFLLVAKNVKKMLSKKKGQTALKEIIGYTYPKLYVGKLDYVYIDRENTAQTRDNYLTFLRVFSSYLVQNSYLKERPTEGVSVLGKRLHRKQRTIIPDGDMIRLYDYWGEEIGRCCLWVFDHDGLIIYLIL